jgi:hypothetical protein
MLETSSTLVTMATRNVGLGRNPVSLFEVGDILADFDHFGGIFMTEEEGKLDSGGRVFVPLVNVDISATNGRSAYPN